MTYLLNDLYPAIQGEGVHAGTPMLLVRLQGCGVQCPWCDTKETWHADPAHAVAAPLKALGTGPAHAPAKGHEIALLARAAAPRLRWALLTGGEPAEHDLGELVAALHHEGFRVALETSGTATGFVGAGCDWVCVSPKLHMRRPFVLDTLRHADEIKFVVAAARDLDEADGLLATADTKPGRIVSLQPVSQQAKATELCVRTALERGWRVSLQLHKYLGAR